jgi:hypothetical protein
MIFIFSMSKVDILIIVGEMYKIKKKKVHLKFIKVHNKAFPQQPFFFFFFFSLFRDF